MTTITGRRSDRRPDFSTENGLVVIRSARLDDTEAVLDIWLEGWWDGHGAMAPEHLRRHRDRAGLAARLEPLMTGMQVAETGGRVVGFVTIKDSELSNLFVARSARGSDTACRLLATGEAMLAGNGIAEAFLWCAAGNDRAYRFYLREGWRDGGIVQCDVATPDGPARLPSHRMLKTPAVQRGA